MSHNLCVTNFYFSVEDVSEGAGGGGAEGAAAAINENLFLEDDDLDGLDDELDDLELSDDQDQ